MADVLKRMYGPAQPGTGNTALYTAPATGAAMRHIRVCNTTGTAATITIALDGTSATAANHWLSAYSVPANGTYDWTGFEAIGNTGTITALQGTSSALTVTISGVEV